MDPSGTQVRVVQGDITTLDVDAVVNAANSGLTDGSGVNGAIHRRGGPEIPAACRVVVAEQGRVPPGSAAITTAGLLPARWVVHAVGPIWSGEDPDGQDEVLRSAYTSSLDAAASHGARTIAFPNISTGVFGYPKARAAPVAIDAVRSWIEANPGAYDEVLFVCFDEENERLYRENLGA